MKLVKAAEQELFLVREVHIEGRTAEVRVVGIGAYGQQEMAISVSGSRVAVSW